MIAGIGLVLFCCCFLLAAFRLGTTMRNNGCNGIVDTIDQGSGAGTIRGYTGAQPTNVSDNPSGTALFTCTFSDPAFGNAGATVAGRADASAITSDTSADASGTCEHFAIYDSDVNPLADGTAAAGSGDLNFDNNVIVIGGTVAISSFQVTQPI